MKYELTDIKLKHKRFETTDGLYHTEADSQHYSYWYDSDGQSIYSNRGYDYCFACEEGKEGALKLLNKHLE